MRYAGSAPCRNGRSAVNLSGCRRDQQKSGEPVHAQRDCRHRRNRGMIRLMKNDNAGGIADYNKALEYEPSDAYSWNNRGIAKRDSGDKAGAIADFKKALAINPDLPSTRQSLRELGVR
jgi:tetratricopeptide (TPR) repeat protein